MGIMIPAWVEGELTPVDKLEAHEKGLKHKAVSVFVVRGTEILMQRRALGKYHTPGLWANTCCTHPDWDETSSICAVRRLQEELGITGLYPEYRHRLEYHADVGNGIDGDRGLAADTLGIGTVLQREAFVTGVCFPDRQGVP